ncbi:3,4-dihydroxy-2-butanone-4-phosphate synthase [Neptunicella sp.]|uniref:3,4-dihydroxy-2-butanone-4-phosphate synthase n=1 Tax=Neptunicella sp. TaxID=2125986 RepID=UPI003F68E7D3
MSQTLQHYFGAPLQRVENALDALKEGQGVLLVDDEDRENEGDLIFSSQHLTVEQMALMIRECSGIVCLCMEDIDIKRLKLPPMVKDNSSHYKTAFTASIEARHGVTTGVSAKDRVTTIRVASDPESLPEQLSRPGHIFPLRAEPGGVLSRRGHTEGTVDLMKLAGLLPSGVLCELTNVDGSMARLPNIIDFALQHQMPVLTIEDIADYRRRLLQQAG